MPVRARILAVALAVAFAAVGLAAAQRAGADPPCTTQWTAAGDGSWSDATKWDHGVPVKDSVVCIPANHTVTYSSGTVDIADLFADGNVTITGGILQITDTANDSRIGTFAQTNGTLGGAATVVLTSGGTWGGGTWADGGVTEIPAGQTLSLNQFTVSLTGARKMDNFGSVLFATPQSGLSGFNTARIVNESSGVIRKTVGSTTTTATQSGISAPVENDGKVESVANLGILTLGAGSGGISTGTYGSAAAAGQVQLTGSAVHTLGDGARLLDGSVIVGNVDVVADGALPATASGASMTNGNLGGDGALSITGPFRWAGGTMKGAGTTTVQAGQTVTLDQFTVSLSESRVFDNFGTMLFATQQSGLSGFNTARIVNESSGVIRKTVGSSTATATQSGISAPVENDGKVESLANLGILSLGAGSGATSTGTYGSAGAAGIVQLAGSAVHTLGDGAKLLDGALIIGNVDVVAASGTPATASNASMTNGNLGGDGVLSITGPFRWAGGTMKGTGTTIVQAGQTVTLDQFTVNLSESRVLDNFGTMLFATAGGGLSGFNTARIVNEPSGVMRKTVGASTSPAAQSGISAPVENDGKIESVAALGNVLLTGGTGATSSGTYGSAGAAGQVVFGGSPVYTLGDGAKLLDGVVLSANSITIPAGATVSANGARETTGTLGGAGTLAIAGGTFTYSGGTMNGTGVTGVAPGATLAVTGPISIGDTRELDIGGLMNITGDTFVGFSANALIHVLAGGAMRKTGGTNATGSLVTVPVRNDGAIESQSGRLELLNGTGVPDTGTFKGKDAANHLVLTGTGHVLAGTAKLLDFSEIAGHVDVKPGDTLTVANEIYETNGGVLTGDVNVTGILHWSGGDQAGTGTTTVAPAGQVLIDNSCSDAVLRDGRRLVNQGTMKLTRHSIVAMFGNTAAPAIESSGTIDIDDSAAGDCTDSGFSGTGLLHNTGTITKHGGAGVAELLVTFDNDGTLQATTGTVKMESAETVTQSGTFNSAAGATYAFDDGVFVLDPAAVLTGSPSITGAAVQIPDGVTVTVPSGATMLIDGGGITGAGTVRIAGTLTWHEGGQVGPGTTVIEPGGAATLVSADPQNPAFGALTGRSLVNEGTVTVDNGVLSAFGGASILNRGLFVVTGESDLEGFGSPGRYSGLFHNVGTLRKTGAGSVPASMALDNDGTIEVNQGTLDASALMNYTGGPFAAQPGAIVDGTYEVSNGGSLGVPGPVQVIAGRVLLDGDASQLVAPNLGGGGALSDALTDLRKIGGNGELELANGKSLSTTSASGAFTNAGSLRLHGGTTFNATGGYTQAPGAVLRTNASGTPGVLAVTGAAALAGRLDVLSAPATVANVVTYGSRTGTFSTVTGSGFAVSYDAGGVSLHAPGHLTVAGEPAPAKGVPVAAPVPDPQLALDVAALSVSGPWARRGAYLVVTSRGATLVRRGVSGRGIDLVAATGPRAGAVRVSWAGRSRTVSLRAAAGGRRTIKVLRLARSRTGTVVVRTRSARPVAIASLVVRR